MQNTTVVSQEQKILNYMPLVWKIAIGVHSKLRAESQRTHDVEDLVQAGTMGLMQVVESFDSEGVKHLAAAFTVAAKLRIYGAIMNDIRDVSCRIDRSIAKDKTLKAAESVLAQILGRAAEQEEVAAHMGMSMAEYQNFVSRSSRNIARAVSLEEQSVDKHLSVSSTTKAEDHMVADDRPSALDVMLERERHEQLQAAIASLPEREQTLVREHFMSGKSLEESGKVIDISKTRAHQVLKAALAKLRNHMEGNMAVAA